MRLYYHKTDGGAEYLCSSQVGGTEEGSLHSKYIVRIDGDIGKDAELLIKEIGPDEYKCSACGGIFTKGWSDEEALSEKDIIFNNISTDECAMVCEDCFLAINKAFDFIPPHLLKGFSEEVDDDTGD